jgi:hypothetical protein
MARPSKRTAPDAPAAPDAPGRGAVTLRSPRGLALTVGLVLVALIVGLIIAPGGPSGLLVSQYADANIAALVPVGWQNEHLAGPFGTALDEWVDPGNSSKYEIVQASRPANGSPQARARALAGRLRHRDGYVQSYLGTVSFAGGRPAWELEYSLDGHNYAVFEFDACPVATAVTVTLRASSSGVPDNEQLTLPEGAEPVCDGPAFTSPDRADLAIPLRLPS